MMRWRNFCRENLIISKNDAELEKLCSDFGRISALCKESCIKTGKFARETESGNGNTIIAWRSICKRKVIWKL